VKVLFSVAIAPPFALLGSTPAPLDDTHEASYRSGELVEGHVLEGALDSTLSGSRVGSAYPLPGAVSL
jgi:hypothetical protein